MRASYSVVRSVVRGKISSSSCGRPSIDGGAVVVLAVTDIYTVTSRGDIDLAIS